MNLITYLFLGITFAFAAVVQPGPYQTYIISQSIKHGFRNTWPAALAPLLSDGPIIILVLFLLNNIPDWFVHFLQIAGAMFLFFLAFKAFKSWKYYNFAEAVNSQSKHQTLFEAATVNFLNPAPFLSWSLVMGPIFLEGIEQSLSYGIALLAGFYSVMVLGQFALILLFTYARALGPKISRITLGISVLALTGFAFFQFYLGISIFTG